MREWEQSWRLNKERRKTKIKSKRKREKIILFYSYILTTVGSKYPDGGGRFKVSIGKIAIGGFLLFTRQC